MDNLLVGFVPEVRPPTNLSPTTQHTNTTVAEHHIAVNVKKKRALAVNFTADFGGSIGSTFGDSSFSYA
jgi:hypothetical protein